MGAFSLLTQVAVWLLWANTASGFIINLNRTETLFNGKTATAANIECFPAESWRATTDIDGCRPTLNILKRLPNYKRVQDFIEYRIPKDPGPPPYTWHYVASSCVVRTASMDPMARDAFSFEGVRALATEIIEYCGDHGRGGSGGFARIGHASRFQVQVFGFKLRPPTADTNTA